ncbi:hypothetical protein AB6A40_010187 [Gnathostoma spinigerum]|uniref:Neuroendocrine protein 7B2 n=1 Tax=Gnathostoma spinigerum TaxID=75299 RepID=A0ABD6EUI8_9BILA
MLTALLSVTLALAGKAMDFNSDLSQQMYSDFIELMSRDIEALPDAISTGHKFMTGGAGEGDQKLRPESPFEERQQVKSDNVLPAYCNPPNPCPIGYTADDGCLEEFDNTAAFSRDYQQAQECICDQEHMFDCPGKSTGDFEDGLHHIFDEPGFHKSLIAKKFHEKRNSIEVTKT